MYIVYASDDNYAEIAGVSILSLLENNKEVDNITIFMLDNGISVENKSRLLSIAEKYSRELIFVSMFDIETFINKKIEISVPHLSITAFARLFVASVLPKYIDRLIYLDCDTIVNSSLLSLWNENLSGFCSGGVLGYASKLHKKSIYLKNTDTYINTGVLLIDLKLWRNLNIEDKFVNFINLLDGKIPVADQGVINGVLHKYIKPLHPKYNYYSTAYNEGGKKQCVKHTGIVNFYDNYIFEQAKQSPVIIHFVSHNKPWIKGNTHIYQDKYMMYRDMTPWINFALREPISKSGNVLKKAIRNIENCFPKPIYRKYQILRSIMGGGGYKLLLYSKKRLKQSEIKLEDCVLNLNN